MKRVVQFSSGVGSYLAACRVVAQYGTDDLVLLFADVKKEDPDNYRFLRQSAARLGVAVTTVTEGRTPMQVMRDEHFLGNSRFTPCTKVLKIDPCRRWLEEHADPADTVLYAGIDYHEQRRIPGITAGWKPWRVEYPMCNPPHWTKAQMLDEVRRHGIEPPLMYAQGFSHANCAGSCVRGGIAHWRLQLAVNPDAFAEWADFEQEMRGAYGNVSILRRQHAGARSAYTLAQLRGETAPPVS